MKAVILAGGAGTRLKEVVNDIPKPMASVAGKPFLEYLVLQLKKDYIKDIILSTGYNKDVIKSYFGAGERWCVSISYSEEDKPLGTGGALKKAVSMIDDEVIMVLNGDSFLEVDIQGLIAFHKMRHARATIGLAYMEDASRYGKVEINNKKEIVRFTEKGVSAHGLINGGIYIFNREIINYIPEGMVSLEKQVLPIFVNNCMYGMEIRGFFVDIGIPEDYLNLKENPQRLLAALNTGTRITLYDK